MLSAKCLNSRSESYRSSRFGLGRFFFPVPRRRRGFQRIEKSSRGFSYFVNGVVERILVGLRRLIEPADLSDELKRSRPDLFRSDRRFEVEKGFDISAHAR